MTLSMLALILIAVTMSACAQLALKLGMKGPSVTAGIAGGAAIAAILSVAFKPMDHIGPGHLRAGRPCCGSGCCPRWSFRSPTPLLGSASW